MVVGTEDMEIQVEDTKALVNVDMDLEDIINQTMASVDILMLSGREAMTVRKSRFVLAMISQVTYEIIFQEDTKRR